MGHLDRNMTDRVATAAQAAVCRTRVAVIADDDEFFRMALASVLTQTCGIDRVVQTGSYDEAMEALALEDDVDVALFDLNMPGMEGPAVLHDVRAACPQIRKVAVVSASRSRDDIIATLAAGAHGFVCKASGVRELQAALDDILHNRIYVPSLLADMAQPAPAAAPVADRAIAAEAPARAACDTTLPALSPRQSHVLEMLVHGKSNKEIARELNLGAGTVKVHMAALFSKLGVPNRAAAAVAGTRLLGHA
jgi:DNA-binding NarL/FixJ family response regulator